MIKIEKIVFMFNDKRFEFTLEEVKDLREEIDRLLTSVAKPHEWFYVTTSAKK